MIPSTKDLSQRCWACKARGRHEMLSPYNNPSNAWDVELGSQLEELGPRKVFVTRIKGKNLISLAPLHLSKEDKNPLNQGKVLSDDSWSGNPPREELPRKPPRNQEKWHSIQVIVISALIRCSYLMHAAFNNEWPA